MRVRGSLYGHCDNRASGHETIDADHYQGCQAMTRAADTT
jgi:hypothetical protein